MRNVAEVRKRYKKVGENHTADQMNQPTTEVGDHNVVAQPTEQQQQMVQSLSERATLVHSGNVDPSVDNMLKITSDGRKLGLDQRIVNPLLTVPPGSKVTLCVDNILRTCMDGAFGILTQLLFVNIYTPQMSSGHGGPNLTIYHHIPQNLSDMWIPASQTALSRCP